MKQQTERPTLLTKDMSVLLVALSCGVEVIIYEV